MTGGPLLTHSPRFSTAVFQCKAIDFNVAPTRAPSLCITPPDPAAPTDPVALSISWADTTTNATAYQLPKLNVATRAFEVLETHPSGTFSTTLQVPAASVADLVIAIRAINANGASPYSSMFDAQGHNLAHLDTDGDGLDDATEVSLGLRRDYWDSDGDGVSDALDGAPLDPHLKVPSQPTSQGYAGIYLDGFTAVRIGPKGVLFGYKLNQPGFWRQGQFSPFSFPQDWSSDPDRVDGIVASEMDLEKPQLMVTIQYVINNNGTQPEGESGDPELNPLGQFSTILATLMDDGTVQVVSDIAPTTVSCKGVGFLSGGRRVVSVKRLVNNLVVPRNEIHDASGGVEVNLSAAGTTTILATDGSSQILGSHLVNASQKPAVWSGGTWRDLSTSGGVAIGQNGVVFGNVSNLASHWSIDPAHPGPYALQQMTVTLSTPVPSQASVPSATATYKFRQARPDDGTAILDLASGTGPAPVLLRSGQYLTLAEIHSEITSNGGADKIGPGGMVTTDRESGDPGGRKLWVPAQMVVDYNRDGKIDREDYGKMTPKNPFRWWYNDDNDEGDVAYGDSDVPTGTLGNGGDARVNGRSDIVDFFPVHLDIQKLLEIFPPTSTRKYRLRSEGDYRFVYTNLRPDEAGSYLLDSSRPDRSDYGVGRDVPLRSAPTISTFPGTDLDESFLQRVGEGKGVILVECVRLVPVAPYPGNPLRIPDGLYLEVVKSGVVVTSIRLNVVASSVEDFYRRINLRRVVETSPTLEIQSYQPPNYPDELTSGKRFFFIHGYNVRAHSARGWHAEIFKRLHVLGSRARFYGISWAGDTSKFPPRMDEAYCIGGSSPDYYANVANAFETAPFLAQAVNSIPGVRVIAAHSLGNMVTCGALRPDVDYPFPALQVGKYLMIDAAVPREAFDASLSHVYYMGHPWWYDYPRKVWPTDWYQLFPPTDGRNRLTWRNRFGILPNVLNFYSSTEEVLENGSGVVPTFACNGRLAWVQQEMSKGTLAAVAVSLVGPSPCHGGWGVNPVWIQSDGNPLSPSAAEALTEDQLRLHSFFLPIQPTDIYDPSFGAAVAIAKKRFILAQAIPALSFATGANDIPQFGPANNINMNSYRDEFHWPDGRLDWRHSDFREVALTFTQGVYMRWINAATLKK